MVSSKQNSQLWLNNNHSDNKIIILDKIMGLIFLAFNRKLMGWSVWISKGTAPEGLKKNMSISPKQPMMSITSFYFYQNEDKMQQYNLSSPKRQPSITSKRKNKIKYPHCIKRDNFSLCWYLTPLLLHGRASKSTDAVLRQGI